MKFSEMPYERPDIEALKTQYAAFTERLKAAADYAEAKAVFLEMEALSKHTQTQAVLCSIRHSIDTRDKFYDEEEKFWNAAGPELQEYEQAWTAALLASPFRLEFSREYGELIQTPLLQGLPYLFRVSVFDTDALNLGIASFIVDRQQGHGE